MKTCKICGIEKSFDDFYIRGIGIKGQNIYHSYCEPCRKNKDKQRLLTPEIKQRNKVRRDALTNETRRKLRDFFKDKACKLCTESAQCCLQFHHKDPSQKSFNISMSLLRNWNKILIEIEKCDILCANCHAKTTSIEQNWYASIADGTH